MKTKILVTGGMGYIGSHTIVDLIEHGYDVVSVDNCSRADESALEGIRAITQHQIRNYQIDLCDPDAVRKPV
jgi:UDP-glucose 4-epimerase